MVDRVSQACVISTHSALTGGDVRPVDFIDCVAWISTHSALTGGDALPLRFCR